MPEKVQELNERLQGYRTFLVSLAMLISMAASHFDVVIPADFVERFAHEIITLIVTVYTFMRWITTGPVGDVFRSLLARRK